MYTYTHSQSHTHKRMGIHIYTYTNTYIYTQAYTKHTNIHSHTYAHNNMYELGWFESLFVPEMTKCNFSYQYCIVIQSNNNVTPILTSSKNIHKFYYNCGLVWYIA